MVKRTDLPDEQEEFPYDGEEFGENLNPEPIDQPPKSRLKTILLNKRIMVPVGVVIAAFIIYQFLSHETQVLPEEALEQHQQVQQTFAASKNASLNADATTAIATPPTEGLQTQVENLAQMAQQNQSQVQQLQTNLQQSQTVLAEMGKNLEDLNNQMQSLGQTPITSTKTSKFTVKRTSAPRPLYTIRAIIPGRAWLETSRGSKALMTVKVGDVIPRYGQVQIIDAGQGIVVTSLGDAISYGLNDS